MNPKPMRNLCAAARRAALALVPILVLCAAVCPAAPAAATTTASESVTSSAAAWAGRSRPAEPGAQHRGGGRMGEPGMMQGMGPGVGMGAPAGFDDSFTEMDEEAAENAAASEGAVPELPSFLTVLLDMTIAGTPVRDTHYGHFIHAYEKQIILLFILLGMGLGIWGTLSMRAMMPCKVQVFLEMVVESAYKGLTGVLGPQGREHVPFLATIFVFILVCNLCGLIPLVGAPTSKFQTTVTLALCVAVYVNYNSLRKGGLWHWAHHLLGAPQDIITWVLSPLFLMLNLIEEIARPASLALRLFGNILGKDILLGVFMLLGISLMSTVWEQPLIGVPLHFPLMFLALLLSILQAVVFTVLSTIYLVLALPHEEAEGH